MVAAATGEIPDEGLTVGSHVDRSAPAPAIRAACAEVRALFAAAAAARLGCTAEELDVARRRVPQGRPATGLDYWTLAGDVDLARDADRRGGAEDAGPASASSARATRGSTCRPSCSAAAFLHDLALPGLRTPGCCASPGPRRRLASLDEAAVRRGRRPTSTS